MRFTILAILFLTIASANTAACGDALQAMLTKVNSITPASPKDVAAQVAQFKVIRPLGLAILKNCSGYTLTQFEAYIDQVTKGSYNTNKAECKSFVESLYETFQDLQNPGKDTDLAADLNSTLIEIASIKNTCLSA